jgi:hypothetical protein
LQHICRIEAALLATSIPQAGLVLFTDSRPVPQVEGVGTDVCEDERVLWVVAAATVFVKVEAVLVPSAEVVANAAMVERVRVVFLVI